MKIKYIIPLILLFSYFKTQAQSEIIKTEVKLLTLSMGDSILLRWAFTNYDAWDYAMKNGYILERVSVNPLTHKAYESKYIALTPNPIKHYSYDMFEKILSKKDTFLAIAAQSLFGKSFVVAQPNQGFIDQLNNSVNEKLNRHAFALYAAEMNFNAAKSLGWAFVDKNVKKDTRYIYRLYCKNEANKFISDTALSVIDTKEKYIKRMGPYLSLTSGEKAITLNWDKQEYTAFYIERSEDGTRFERLNKKPYLTWNHKSKQNENMMGYLDTLTQNYKTYYYRIIGINSFGMLSYPSPVIQGQGKDLTAPLPPEITYFKNISEKTVKLKWKQAGTDTDIKGYYVGKAKDIEGPYTEINREILAAGTTEFIDNNASEHSTNFYKIIVIDKNLNHSHSLPHYVVMTDTKAPDLPNKPSGTIDTNGIVILKWPKGKEPDLMGYNIYRANQKDHKFIGINKLIHCDTLYMDTIGLKNLTEKVYYRIEALDKHYRSSPQSEILELIKPDKVAPVAPVFVNYLVDSKSIKLEWTASPSKDVVKYRLLRKEHQSKEWKNYRDFDIKTLKFSDSNTVMLQIYDYALISIDDAGLLSPPSFTVSLKVFDSGVRKDIDNVKVTFNEKKKSCLLKWNYSQNKHEAFIIYRIENNNELQMYKRVDAKTLEFEDLRIKNGSTYQYAVQAVYQDGGKSALSPFVKIEVNMK